MDAQALQNQIAQEKAELAAVPALPLHSFVGASQRCHFCGGTAPELFSVESVQTERAGEHNRLACGNCHPDIRGQK
jgi:hypothetical protein